MTDQVIDLYKKFFRYENQEVYIAFHDTTGEPYFHVRQVCKLFGYSDCRKALSNNVDERDIMYLCDIVSDYEKLYKNVQKHTKFISEAGLLTLAFKSRKKNARDITRWMAVDVFPEIRKYGQYSLDEE